MALPVRVEHRRGNATDPLDIIRRDFDVLGRIFGGGLLDDTNDGALASLSNFGVDIREDRDHIYVEADLPGFRKGDVDVTIEDGTLTITAERQEEITAPPGQAPDKQGAFGQDQQAQPPSGQQAGKQAEQGHDGGEQQQQRQQPPQGNYLLRERRVRRFVRSFALPPNVDEQSIQAKLENGVLTVVLNKREDAKPKRINVA